MDDNAEKKEVASILNNMLTQSDLKFERDIPQKAKIFNFVVRRGVPQKAKRILCPACLEETPNNASV